MGIFLTEIHLKAYDRNVCNRLSILDVSYYNCILYDWKYNTKHIYIFIEWISGEIKISAIQLDFGSPIFFLEYCIDLLHFGFFKTIKQFNKNHWAIL